MLAVFIVVAILGVIPAAIASAKGHSFALWWLYGLLIFPVALAHSLITYNVAAERARVEARREATTMRKCPHCAEPIRREALVCRYCGRDVPPETTAPRA